MRRKKAYDHTCFPYCGVSLRTVQFMAQNVDGCSTEMMYAALQLLHTDARESTVGAMMAGLDPNCGLCCEDSIRKVVWPLMQKTVEVLEGSWLTAREEWLHHPANEKYKDVLVSSMYSSCRIIGSGDTSPLKCVSTIKYVFQPKYATSVVKEFSIATHTGYVIYLSKTLYTGSTSDGIILEVELRNEKLRTLLTKYGILLDGGFHPTSIPRGAEDAVPPTYHDADALAEGRDYLAEALEEGEIEFIPPNLDDASDDAASDAGVSGGFAEAKLFFPVKKPQIWPKHLGPTQSIEDYNANAETLLEFNERIGFVRARIEHRYGDSGAPMPPYVTKSIAWASEAFATRGACT